MLKRVPGRTREIVDPASTSLQQDIPSSRQSRYSPLECPAQQPPHSVLGRALRTGVVFPSLHHSKGVSWKLRLPGFRSWCQAVLCYVPWFATLVTVDSHAKLSFGGTKLVNIL